MIQCGNSFAGATVVASIYPIKYKHGFAPREQYLIQRRGDSTDVAPTLG